METEFDIVEKDDLKKLATLAEAAIETGLTLRIIKESDTDGFGSIIYNYKFTLLS